MIYLKLTAICNSPTVKVGDVFFFLGDVYSSIIMHINYNIHLTTLLTQGHLLNAIHHVFPVFHNRDNAIADTC